MKCFPGRLSASTCLILLSLAAFTNGARSQSQNTQSADKQNEVVQSDTVLRTNTRLVVTDVVATDSKWKASHKFKRG